MNERATESAGFLDGREYTASFLYEFFALFVGNGVYANELTPTATNENMTVTHGAGHAWINGVVYKNALPIQLEIDTADGSLNRYDSLMVRLNLSTNEAYAWIEKGEFAMAPTPPSCTRNAEIYDLKICDIYIPAGCTKITQAQIYDRRMDAAVCGVPVFPIEHMDMTAFYRQVANDLTNFRANAQAEFSAWAQSQQEKRTGTMDELVELVRNLSSRSMEQINQYVDELEAKGDADVAAIVAAMSEMKRTEQEKFAAWFEYVRGQLDEDAAGRLTNTTKALEEQMAIIQYMVLHNDYFAPILDEDGNTILDEDGNAILGQWCYKNA